MRRYHHLGHFAATTPDKLAVVDAAGNASLTYAELDARSNRLARLLHRHGVRRGDHLAVVMDSQLRVLEVAWAALRSGLRVTPVSPNLSVDHAAHVLSDCDARVVVASWARCELASRMTDRLPYCEQRLMTDGCIPGWDSYEEAVAAEPASPLPEQWLGTPLFYSAGTTGRPKGVVRTGPLRSLEEGPHAATAGLLRRYGFDAASVALVALPLCDSMGLESAVHLQFCGGTVVFMPALEPQAALCAIARHRVTHSHWSPGTFAQLLALPAPQRARDDLSSQRCAIHSGTPCPVHVKRAMIEWWGPILHEQYGSIEANGLTAIDSREALARPGSVGRSALGVVRICDMSGAELPAGHEGLVYFEREQLPFRYYKDDAQTRSAQHPRHPNWTTAGDIGHVDADGYLYLHGRREWADAARAARFG